MDIGIYEINCRMSSKVVQLIKTMKIYGKIKNKKSVPGKRDTAIFNINNKIIRAIAEKACILHNYLLFYRMPEYHQGNSLIEFWRQTESRCLIWET